MKDDMYYSNSAICDLNRIINIRSIWEFVDSSKNAVETIQHIKKVFTSPKANQAKKKLGNRRLSMSEYKDSTHFTLITAAGTAAYLGGEKVNENKSVSKITVDGNNIKFETVKQHN